MTKRWLQINQAMVTNQPKFKVTKRAGYEMTTLQDPFKRQKCGQSYGYSDNCTQLMSMNISSGNSTINGKTLPFVGLHNTCQVAWLQLDLLQTSRSFLYKIRVKRKKIMTRIK